MQMTCASKELRVLKAGEEEMLNMIDVIPISKNKEEFKARC